MTCTNVFNNMAVVAGEEESPGFNHVYLHRHQSICVPWQVVESNPLTEVKGLVIERFPIATCD